MEEDEVTKEALVGAVQMARRGVVGMGASLVGLSKETSLLAMVVATEVVVEMAEVSLEDAAMMVATEERAVATAAATTVY